MENDSHNNQFIVSYELLALLRWLIDHDVDKLRKIIAKAFAAGLKDEIHRLQTNPEMSLEEIHYTIIEFLGVVDLLLVEQDQENMVQRAREQKLLPAIDHIDSTVFDTETVRGSLEKATSPGIKTKENAKATLYKELLKRWKPGKKMEVN